MKRHSFLRFSIRLIGAALLSIVFCVSACAQNAVDVFNSFGPGNAYNVAGGWVVAGSGGILDGTTYVGMAEYFVPQVSGYLDQIQLATYFRGGSAVSDFSIAQDNGSGLPGTILESFADVTTPDNGVLTLDSVITPLLQAGQEYWLCDEAASANTDTLWMLNSTGIANNFVVESLEGDWSPASPDGATDAVFSISVVSVPEPSAAAMGLLGVGLFLMRNRRR
ncbi:MAG TPA: PEP-CTERM sorting domain-containing protein [Candidatus Acidoferrum sp.]|nr:PEP-CTERM sorting domain-containing protein [Candidatus Acidoferrum sp.]